MSGSLWPMDWHSRLLCPPLSPQVYSDSCPLSHRSDLFHPLLPPILLPSLFPSFKVFSNESALHIKLPKHWSFSFSISHSNEYSGLISFRIDWLDLLAVQGTLKCLLQHHSSKASILQHSTFFMVQLSHRCMTSRKTLTLTIWTFINVPWANSEAWRMKIRYP